MCRLLSGKAESSLVAFQIILEGIYHVMAIFSIYIGTQFAGAMIYVVSNLFNAHFAARMQSGLLMSWHNPRHVIRLLCALWLKYFGVQGQPERPGQYKTYSNEKNSIHLNNISQKQNKCWITYIGRLIVSSSISFQSNSTTHLTFSTTYGDDPIS